MVKRGFLILLLILAIAPRVVDAQFGGAFYRCDGSYEIFCHQPQNSSQPCGWSVQRYGCRYHSNCSCSQGGNFCYYEDGTCNCSAIIQVHWSQCYLGACGCSVIGEGGQES